MHRKIRSSSGGVRYYASSCNKIISAWFVQSGCCTLLLTRLVRCCWKGLVGVTTWQWKSYRERLLEFDERKIMKMKTTFSRIMTGGRLAMCSLRFYRGLNLNNTKLVLASPDSVWLSVRLTCSRGGRRRQLTGAVKKW